MVLKDRGGQIRTRRTSRRGGFTLIELMVVLSIVALLLTILLPSLGRAREDARRAVCLSNMHQLGNALETYVLAANAYPVWSLTTGFTQGFCSWAWGGKTTSITPWKTSSNGVFYLRAAERPINHMLTRSAIVEPAEITDDSQRSELKIFRCPSDHTSWQAQWGTGGLTYRPAYEDVGTSYQLNYHWYEQVRQNPEPLKRRVEWGVRLLMTRRTRDASRFVLLMEDSLDRSIASRIETLGLHRRWATHNTLMLDGHAQTLKVPRRDLDRLPWPFGSEWSAFDDLRQRGSVQAAAVR